MKAWLLILTIFTIIVVAFAFVNTFLSFKKSDYDEKAVITILPIGDCKKTSLEIQSKSTSKITSGLLLFKKKLIILLKFKKQPVDSQEVVQEVQVQTELLKLKMSLDTLNLRETKLNAIKGIGIRTIEFMHLNNIETLGDLINLAAVDKKTREKIILGLPGLTSESPCVKHEKFSYFVNQAQELVDNIPKNASKK